MVRVELIKVIDLVDSLIRNEFVKASRYALDSDYPAFRKCSIAMQTLESFKTSFNEKFNIVEGE